MTGEPRLDAGAGPGPIAPGVLLDSSAWIRHVRHGDAAVDRAIAEGTALGHPDVAGEVAMGSGEQASRLRDVILGLARVEPLGRADLYALVERLGMNGRGVGWIDAGIVAACIAVDPPVPLYTRDRRMRELAALVGVPLVDPAH